jgi:stress-induced morphogen
MFYYSCKRCNYFTKQKISIKRHLDKINKCRIIDKNNILTDIELYNLSFEKKYMNIKDNNENNIESINIEEKYECNICNKTFHNKSNLQKHIKNNICKNEKSIIESILCNICNKTFHNKSNLQKHVKNNICKNNNDNKSNNIVYNNGNIIINNTVNNNIINYININCIKGFDEDWDVSQIDHEMKEKILMSKSKFSKTLENILNNDVNLNVILNDEVAGIVYSTDKKKYEPMSKKDIIMQSMDKVFKHLKIFYDDIINNNINELSPYLLENIKKEFDHKYKIFFELSSSQETVNNTFTYIYNNKKDDSCKKYNEYINNKETNKKLGY